MIQTKLLAASTALALLVPALSADLVTGRVVDASGAGVANVDIDVKSLSGGGNPAVSGDFTDAAGFFSMTVPTGLYRLTFFPPAPPAATSLATEVDGVLVVGTATLGTIALPPGVALTGRVVRAGGIPVAGVNLDVVDETTGDQLLLQGDLTDLLGRFSVAVPAGPVELRLDATTVAAPVLASRALELAPTAALDLGDVQLAPGFAVTGVVLGPSGLGLQGIDLDFEDVATGYKAYTPKDNTGAGGSFSVVVAAGTWDLIVCPSFASRLVAQTVPAVAVAGPKSVGAVQLQPGVVLSGTVRSHAGAVVPGSDVDARFAFGGAPITLCDDDADALGRYAVIVPPGTLEVTLRPPSYLVPLASEHHPAVAVGGDTALDGTLPHCTFGDNYGFGLAGTGGVVPHLTTAGGTPRVGNEGFSFQLTSCVGGGGAVIVVGVAPISGPALGGTWFVDLLQPFYAFGRVIGGAPGAPGAGSGALPVADFSPDFVGISLFAQFLVLDAAGPEGFALSDALTLTICD